MKNKVLIFGLFILGSLVLAGYSVADINLIRPKIRVKAPGFTLKALDKSVKSLEDWNGKVILLHFFATWCAPCSHEMPSIEKLWNRFKNKNFVVISIAVDRGNPDKVREFCKELGVNFPVLLDPDGNVRNQYEVMALPTSYLIGKDGKFIGKVIGATQWDDAESVKLLDFIL